MYPNLTKKYGKKRIKRKKKKEKQAKSESGKEGERKRKNQVFRFSLRSTEIGPSVFVEREEKLILHIGTKILEFRQTPRRREFSYMGYF